MTGVRRLTGGPDGDDVLAIDLAGGGLTATVLTWGATVQRLCREGQDRSLILGSPELDAYVEDLLYFGAVVGPVANRIAGGRFELEGAVFDLDRNEAGLTTLHGGRSGFGERNWSLADHGPTHCTLHLDHGDGEGGFPGPISVSVTYRLVEAETLDITISGLSGQETVFNPAFHGYWNLDGSDTVLSHVLWIDAGRYTPVDDRLIPTGAPAGVGGTQFDYRDPRPVGPNLDHNFCTAAARGPLRPVAWLEAGGTRLTVETTEPGLQVYSAGATPSGRWAGHSGRPFPRHAGVALEPQVWPDAPNRPDFPSVRLSPGTPYTQRSLFRLSDP